MASQFPAAIDGKLKDVINEAKVLIVGAGGIGCELLKGVVQMGLKDIEVVDMDTIEVSNLNRQFLFRKKHVGMSKAYVARESVLRFNPEAKITAHHASITSPEFGVPFFKKFDVVMNALDNRTARSYVNQMCLIADVPLIESGTAGYTGQVELIKKGMTQCYDCIPQSKEKTYATCTIRNTPSEPIHCIVWAKFLFNQLFGEEDDDEDVSPDTNDPELNNSNAENSTHSVSEEPTSSENENSEKKANGVTSEKTTVITTRKWAQNTNYDGQKLFQKLFNDDVKYLLRMDKLWESRKPPKSIDWADIQKEEDSDASSSQPQNRRILSLKEYCKIFFECFSNLKEQFFAQEDGKVLVWDKEDKYAMDFVAAAANIRAHIFGISLLSQFEIKSMAGRIIPAIATSNAIVAGLICIFVMNVLLKELEKCKTVYLRSKVNHRNVFIVPEKFLSKREPSCQICASTPTLKLSVDFEKTTLNFIETEILKKALNVSAPEVYIQTDSVVKILISGDEDEELEISNKTLSEIDLQSGTVVTVDGTDGSFKLIITHKPSETVEYTITGDLPTPQPESEPGTSKGEQPSTSSEKSESGKSGNAENGTVSDDDLEIVEDVVGVKRKAEFSESNDAKRMKTDVNEADGNDSDIECL